MITVPFGIIFILVLILGNGFLAMAEISIVSARKARLQSRAEAGSRRYQAALDMANSPGNFLSTVQIGITLVGTLASTIGGAEAVGGHRQHSRTGADIEDRETVARNLFEVHQRQPGRFVSSAAERGTRNHREPEPARRNTP